MKKNQWTALAMASVFSLSSLGVAAGVSGAAMATSVAQHRSALVVKHANSAPFTLRFVFWGSNFEEQAQQQMGQQFTKLHPTITINPEIAPTNFQTKLNALMAAHQLPDMSYLGSGQALVWGQEGHVLNIAPYLKKYPQLRGWMPQTYVYWAPDKFTTLSTLETEDLYYNPAIFQAAHIALPPARGSKAWTWSQFVHVAEELTVDDHGLHPYQKGFDPNHIKQYGVDIPVGGYLGWYPYLLSSGGSITNPAGTQYTMNSPQAVRAFQDLHDLIWKYHVCPTPTVQATLPASNVMLQTGQFAMVMDGQWNLLSYAQSHVKFGIGVLPKIVVPRDFAFSGATVIYTSSKNVNDAVQYLTYESNPLSSLVTGGLWMPVRKQYYTNPKLLDEWTNNPAHPPEYKTAVAQYMLKYAAGDPGNSIKNFVQIDPIIEQNLALIWENKQPVQKVLDNIGKSVQPMLQGVWPGSNKE